MPKYVATRKNAGGARRAVFRASEAPRQTNSAGKPRRAAARRNPYGNSKNSLLISLIPGNFCSANRCSQPKPLASVDQTCLIDEVRDHLLKR